MKTVLIYTTGEYDSFNVHAEYFNEASDAQKRVNELMPKYENFEVLFCAQYFSEFEFIPKEKIIEYEMVVKNK